MSPTDRPRLIVPGISCFAARTPTLPPATHTNSYALGDDELLIVEPATPFDDEQASWLAWARSLETGGRRIVGIVATHHHPDHVGGAAVFAKELGRPLFAHPETASRLPRLAFARMLRDGDVFELRGGQRWEVLHTPGHAPGHVCLFERRLGVLVAGDMVASVGTILVEPGDGDMSEYLRQLERLEALGATVALPAHGEPITDPRALFRHYVRHRQMREERVEAALRAAGALGATLDALLPSAYADTSSTLWPLARLSLEAHLVKLEREGRAMRRDDLWISC